MDDHSALIYYMGEKYIEFEDKLYLKHAKLMLFSNSSFTLIRIKKPEFYHRGSEACCTSFGQTTGSTFYRTMMKHAILV